MVLDPICGVYNVKKTPPRGFEIGDWWKGKLPAISPGHSPRHSTWSLSDPHAGQSPWLPRTNKSQLWDGSLKFSSPFPKSTPPVLVGGGVRKNWDPFKVFPGIHLAGSLSLVGGIWLGGSQTLLQPKPLASRIFFNYCAHHCTYYFSYYIF